MTLAAGQTLTHYEILGPLGAGGMGEVYRARDKRLGREVAIKVLPEELADDEERLRRFEREARTLASLNHANLAHVYGIDQVESTCFIAMELVPGEDLATRVARGPLPVDEAVDVCRQIAEGLEAAHEAGVVHRDLKPANVRITPEGVVKILDFGLAKPARPRATKDGATTAEPDSFLVTEEGLVLGTPTYMSPEQARGRPVDKRADVWAFGCVLYECLTGERAFDGPSLPDVFASILSEAPDWSRLPSLPVRVRELLDRALTKDPRTRLRDIGEARVHLTLAATEPPASSSPSGRRYGVLLISAVLATGAAFAVGLGVGGASGSAEGAPLETASAPPIAAVLQDFDADQMPGRIMLSPDGLQVGWTDPDGLYLRALDAGQARTVLAKRREAWWVEFTWSPDGRELAFVDEGAIWTVSVDGGSPTRFADFDGYVFTSLRWSSDGRIAYNVKDGIVAVSEGGPRTRLVTTDAKVSHLDEFVLVPGTDFVVAVPHLDDGTADTIELLHGTERRLLVSAPGRNPRPVRVLPDRVLLWSEDDRLWSAPLRPDEEPPLGEARLVVEDRPSPTVGDEGPLVWVEGDASDQLGWIGRDGAPFAPLGSQYRGHGIWSARLSRDCESIVFSVNGSDGTSVTCVHDIERGLSTPRVHRDDGAALSLFLPDGRIAVIPVITGAGTYVYSESGRGDAEHLQDRVLAAASDGTLLLTTTWVPGIGQHVHTSGLGAEERVVLDGEHGETLQELSRDGRWMLYSSQRTGKSQVYLTRFPPGDEEWPVSADGGELAWFGKDDAEILFEHEGVVHRVAFEPAAAPGLGVPEPLFVVPANAQLMDYDDEHGRFLVRRTTGRTQIWVDSGWSTADLER